MLWKKALNNLFQIDFRGRFVIYIFLCTFTPHINKSIPINTWYWIWIYLLAARFLLLFVIVTHTPSSPPTTLTWTQRTEKRLQHITDTIFYIIFFYLFSCAICKYIHILTTNDPTKCDHVIENRNRFYLFVQFDCIYIFIPPLNLFCWFCNFWFLCVLHKACMWWSVFTWIFIPPLYFFNETIISNINSFIFHPFEIPLNSNNNRVH